MPDSAADSLLSLSELAGVYRRLDRLTARRETDAALDLVDRELNLQLDPLSRRVFQLILGKAAEVPRFTGNDHIAPSRKGSVAQHTLMVMPVTAAIGTLAFQNNSPVQQFNAQAWSAPRAAVRDLLHDQLVQVLMHDFGEIFMELSSLSQRRRSELQGEMPQVERRFAEFAMRLGYHCALSYSRPAEQERVFGAVIDDVRQSINAAGHDDKSVVGESAAAQIARAIEPHSDRLHLDLLPREATRQLRHYMAAYDEPEGFSHFAQFSGKLVKHAQNVQTVMHIIEHAGRDGAVPYHLANSGEALGSLWYAERGLPAIAKAARPGNPLHHALALACAELSYQVNLATLMLPFPETVDRTARLRDRLDDKATADDRQRAESHATEAPARQMEIAAASVRWAASNRGPADFSQPELSRAQLRLAYAAALDQVREYDSSYSIPAQPMSKLTELPASLQQEMGRVRLPTQLPPLVAMFVRRPATANRAIIQPA